MKPAEDVKGPKAVLVEITDGPLHDWEDVMRVTDTEDRLIIEKEDGSRVVYREGAWLSYVVGAEVPIDVPMTPTPSPPADGRERVSKGEHRLAHAEPAEQPADLPEEVRCHSCGAELTEEWVEADEQAKEEGTHPAPCPECGGNPLPPVGEGDGD